MMVGKRVGFNSNNYYYSLGCCPGNQAATSLVCTVSRRLLNPAHLTAAAKQPDCAVSGGGGAGSPAPRLMHVPVSTVTGFTRAPRRPHCPGGDGPAVPRSM